jgi:SpoVK/Ycf46/Vps4 family AAA+-type ATPase
LEQKALIEQQNKKQKTNIINKTSIDQPIQPGPPKPKIDLNIDVDTLDELIKFIDEFTPDDKFEYSIDVNKLKALATPLKKLQSLVGMQQIKQSIVNHLFFMLSNLHDREQMKHTVLYGPPGCGKTTLALIMSDIYHAMGYSNGDFKIAKRTDLIGKYVGHTAHITQKFIDSIAGGVLFIDEAYSLGDKENRDSFSKEIIDCLNQNLSEGKNKFICIIAGYKKELQECFFGFNPGLERRFPFQYTISRYSSYELAQIFELMLKSAKWCLDQSDLSLDYIANNIKAHKKQFEHQGGDIETLIQRCKMAYAKRVFGIHQSQKCAINKCDFDQGIEHFVSHKQISLKKPKKDTGLSDPSIKEILKDFKK